MPVESKIEKEVKTIILIGNPNVGKSLIFNYLTGHYVNVSNYPGTTVEITRGRLRKKYGGRRIKN